ncbi:Methylthioribulose-1-phosphate dehydratase [Sodalis glossinidius str. 'morsitans']|uniref:Methylthioribulose-1-phosphate dehydratase n=2 Tax=Sodalis glossinidius (strain morsitans) TaxID=343509 RepID=MTNB_SODGM|nr:methylthioribulose 1-phosphate dehydratase [Sodalis glossinidius]Q2NWC8.1 RecName: Full=Methylthioribulose-1-phosphate dehydratase; Short=MTRu-1-P dehydratase [Sodalis glossinidius str. 'morsitans']BAE73547.1 putative sugar aldolase [Sodalis glossinidius str. 'morsitans']CRL43918.1 Methylthioribulose-1-phosphate dehydratase [Sodalis glossinidius str. 'morsitans']
MQLAELVAACRWIGAKGWSPATGGNMSQRRDVHSCYITESGLDKGHLDAGDFLTVDIQTGAAQPGRRPSAETGLHTFLYRRFPEVGCVLHTHSVSATVLSRAEQGSTLRLSGYEMQKSLTGQTDHREEVAIAVFDNSQDIPALVQRIALQDALTPLRYGFLMCGHGLTCWGRDVREARLHLEGLEFLFECEWRRRLLEAQ